MKLLYDLPESAMESVSGVLNGESIRYCVPADLDEDNVFITDWIALTETRIITVKGGAFREEIAVADGADYKNVTLVGNGILEGEVNGVPRVIARYSMRHVPRYAYIANILNVMSKGRRPMTKSADDEGVCPKCERRMAEGTLICPYCTSKFTVLKKLKDVLSKHIPLLLLAVGMFWVITGISLISPYITRLFINEVLNPIEPGMTTIFGLERGVTAVMAFVSIMALLSVSSSAIVIVRGRIMTLVGNRIANDLRNVVYEKIQALTLNDMTKRKAGDMMNRVTRDTQRIRDFISHQASQGINMLITLIGICVILFATNWRLALLIIVPIPLVGLVIKNFREKMWIIFHKQWHVYDDASNVLNDILTGIRVVKAFGQEEKEIGRFRKASEDFRDISMSNEKFFNTLFPILNFFVGCSQFLILYFGGRMVLGLEMNVGELIQVMEYASMLYAPLGFMTMLPRAIANAMNALGRIYEIMEVEPDIRNADESVTMDIKGKVGFTNVTFGYQSHEPVIEEMDVDVAEGEMIGLVGHSGAGKTTFINLIMRLYDIDDGSISIDSVDLREIDMNVLRSQIGVVLQESFLFSGTVYQNIVYSKRDATPEEVIAAAKIANAHDFILGFPDGYDTRVGENGHNISGGERQRIAIARAILHNPRILILDEATASLDIEAEQQIQEALGRLTKGRTTFAIAHRLSTLRNANRIMVIDKGRKAEMGTHDELLNMKGIYYKLVMAQRQVTRT
ncbi:MAG: ABC transporter ATP-binding protein/permease [Oscillospiraceae bacterium]|nr:ABC transporter ATP-binding protein/permease [Oscillospiraceae bacterium]